HAAPPCARSALTAAAAAALNPMLCSPANPRMPQHSPFVIVPRGEQPRSRRWLWALLWAACLAAAVFAGRQWALAPAAEAAGVAPAELQAQVDDLEERLARLRQRNVILKRSDDVSRAANQELQRDLADRDERIASLEAD